jgi:hypothetical protein
MATPKKRILVLTASVWLAASGSAAALTYELNRPLSTDGAVQVSTAPSSAAPLLPIGPEGVGTASVYLAPVTGVGRPPQRRAAVGSESRETGAAHRDIGAMRCADWRDLDMGSGHVQVCE